MRSPTLSVSEKAAITHTCQAFIDTVLKPRFLPNVHVTPFNYPVDIQGKWHGSKYRFMQRYRSGFDDNRGEEFDAPFAGSTGSGTTASMCNGIGTPGSGSASITTCH